MNWSKEGILPVDKMLKESSVTDFETTRQKMEDGRFIKGFLIW